MKDEREGPIEKGLCVLIIGEISPINTIKRFGKDTKQQKPCCVQTEWVFIQEVKESQKKKGRNQHPI